LFANGAEAYDLVPVLKAVLQPYLPYIREAYPARMGRRMTEQEAWERSPGWWKKWGPMLAVWMGDPGREKERADVGVVRMRAV
jgi:hypothetical protein